MGPPIYAGDAISKLDAHVKFRPYNYDPQLMSYIHTRLVWSSRHQRQGRILPVC